MPLRHYFSIIDITIIIAHISHYAIDYAITPLMIISLLFHYAIPPLIHFAIDTPLLIIISHDISYY
jgi:hypothetical protein